MGLSRTVSDIDSDFSWKSQNFPTTLASRLSGSPWNWVQALGVKKTTMMGLLGWERRYVAISSAVWIQSINVTEGRTDRRTDTGPQQRPCLRIASRGKNLNDGRTRWWKTVWWLGLIRRYNAIATCYMHATCCVLLCTLCTTILIINK